MKLTAILATMALAGCTAQQQYGDDPAIAKTVAGDNKSKGVCIISPSLYGGPPGRAIYAIADETGTTNTTVTVKGDCSEVSVTTTKPQKAAP